MSSDLVQQPATRTYRLDELVKLVATGRIRVPHFQRDFRWSVSDVVDLFDSVLRGFPVGSVLLWKRPAPERSMLLGALRIDAAEVAEALWVVDGQQRVTSLVNALSPVAYDADERFRLDFDIDTGKIVKHADAHRRNSISLPTLFDLRKFLSWTQAHPEMVERIEALNDVASRLREFELPASIVEDPDPAVLREIFDRMNNSGKRLRRAEVFSALYAPDESLNDESLTIQRIAESVEMQTAFGRIDDDTVLRVLLARRGPDVARQIRNEFDEERRKESEFPGEGRDEAYERGQESLERAIRFLQNHAGVPHFTFLPYRYLLVTLARYLAHFPDPSPRNVALLSRWFWRAALRGPEIFKGSATGAMRALCNQVDPADESASIQKLLQATDRPYRPMDPSLRRFRANEAATRVILCALWDARPRSLTTGAVLGVDFLADALEGQATANRACFEIVSRRSVPGDYRMAAANRIIQFPEDEERARSILRGEHLLDGPSGSVLDDVLVSHLLSGESLSALADGRTGDFLAAREHQIAHHVEAFLRRRTEFDLEATRPLTDYDLDDEVGIEDRDDMNSAHAAL